MKLLHCIACATILCFFATTLSAQETDELGIGLDEDTSSGIKSFGKNNQNSWRRGEQTVAQTPVKLEMISAVSDYITPSAIENLMHPELVFCYKVTSKPKGYNGYTLDGLALVSFCGILEQNQIVGLIDQLFTKEGNISPDVEKCTITPQIMFRFIRGVDSTDVLLSNPCHSFTVFYAGSSSIHTYNLSPIADFVDAVVAEFNQKQTEFASPALLKQLLPIGIPQDEEQQKIIDQRNGPIRNWQKQQAEEKQKEEKKTQGWNKLKFK